LWLEICAPKGIVQEVKNEPARRDLHPLRIMVPKELVSEERWKSMKAHPVSMLDSSKGSLSIHSSHGWSENVVKNFNGVDERFLTGYIKVEVTLVDKFLLLSGKSVVFVDI
jgi:hypothetical protein